MVLTSCEARAGLCCVVRSRPQPRRKAERLTSAGPWLTCACTSECFAAMIRSQAPHVISRRTCGSVRQWTGAPQRVRAARGLPPHEPFVCVCEHRRRRQPQGAPWQSSSSRLSPRRDPAAHTRTVCDTVSRSPRALYDGRGASRGRGTRAWRTVGASPLAAADAESDELRRSRLEGRWLAVAVALPAARPGPAAPWSTAGGGGTRSRYSSAHSRSNATTSCARTCRRRRGAASGREGAAGGRGRG